MFNRRFFQHHRHDCLQRQQYNNMAATISRLLLLSRSPTKNTHKNNQINYYRRYLSSKSNNNDNNNDDDIKSSNRNDGNDYKHVQPTHSDAIADNTKTNTIMGRAHKRNNRQQSSSNVDIFSDSHNQCCTNNSENAKWLEKNKSPDNNNATVKRLEKKCLPFVAIPTTATIAATRKRLSPFDSKLMQWLTGKWDNRFHEHVDECHQRLGPIFRESIGPIEAVFVQSPDLLRDVFAYEGKYPKHPVPEAWTLYNQLHNCRRGLFFMDDNEWLQTRKQLAPLMLRNDQRFLGAIEAASDGLIDEWKHISSRSSSSGDFIEIPNALTTLYGWSIRVLMGIMFGHCSAKMCNNLRPTIDQFACTVQNVFEYTVPFATISPQFARKFGLGIWTRFEHSVTETLSIANQIIDYGLEQPQCDGLLRDMQQLGMSIDMIKRIFIDLIIAAGDTSAFSTQWALYLLSQDVPMQQSVRNELLNSDKLETTLVRGAVREALRMFPVATFIGRILAKDAILENYHVAKDTLVLISMYSAGRDEHSFPEAKRFLPWRWNRDSESGALKYVNRAQSFIPYALGARNCIGQRIANSQMHVILTKILRTFEVRLLNEKEIDIVMRLILMPSKPMRFSIKSIVQ